MPKDTDQYVCAISGITAPAGLEDESDGLGDLPSGWTRITITRRQFNPEWIVIQQAKEQIVESFLAQFPPELQDAQRLLFEVQVKAQFHSYEDSVDMYLPDVEDVLDCAGTGEVIELIDQVREQLGLSAMPENDGEEGDDNE